ncbi:oligosaccharide flippase family protein [Rheinheimera sp.]|uniref:lipopolysaccharide biosynthesis protein n=1 Tax=Rheinheimera sp. TaxID=1869214 RepID=UPI00307CFFD5
MNSLKSRLLGGAGAYGYAQIVTIGTQLAGVPIFLSFWDMETYGIWLILCAFPIYIAIADFGVATIAGNKMTMLRASNKKAEANVIFQSALLMCVLIAVVLFLVAILGAFIYQSLAETPSLYMTPLLLLVAAALLALVGNLFDALFRSVGRYALGTLLVTTARLMEWVFSIFGVFLFGTIQSAAIGFFIGRLLMTCVNFFIAISTLKDYQWTFRYSSVTTVRELLKPSLAFMAFPIGNAINLQGVTMLVGLMLGPAAVVIYNTYRTVSRTLVQAVALITKPAWPELSAAFGAKDSNKAKYIVRLMGVYATGTTLLGCFVLYVFGGKIIYLWTHGQVIFDSQVYLYVLAAAAVSAFSQVFVTLIVSTNNHKYFCKFFLFSSALNFIFLYTFARQLGLAGIAAMMLIIEVVLLLSAYLFSKKVQVKEVSV